MDITEAFEEKFSEQRNSLFELLRNSNSFHIGALQIFSDCFNGENDKTKHGPIFWALMVKAIKGEKRVVLGSILGIYVQYYYYYFVQSCHRPLNSIRRRLDLSSMWFIICAASFPLEKASEEFHKWRIENNHELFDNLVIERPNFLKFFWSGTYDQFSFIGAMKIIDKLWDIWDATDPVRIHGFDTVSLSSELLNHYQQEGAFMFRFSSEGGLAVDYYHKGSVKQYHWKAESLNLNHFLAHLHNPTLKYLVTISRENKANEDQSLIYPKGTLFQDIDNPEVSNQELCFLQETINRLEDTVEKLEATIKKQDIDYKESEQKIRYLEDTIYQKEELNKSISNKLMEQKRKTEEAIGNSTKDILNRSQTIGALEKQLAECQLKIQEFEANARKKEKELKDLQEILIQKESHANNLKEDYGKKEQQYDLQVKEKNYLQDEKNRLNLWLIEVMRTVHQENPDVDFHYSEIPTDTIGKINLLTEKIKDLRKSLKDLEDNKHEKIQTLESKLAASQYSLQDLERKLELKEEEFNNSLQDLERKLELKEEEFNNSQKLENEYRDLEEDYKEKLQIIQQLTEDLKTKKSHEEKLENELSEMLKVIKKNQNSEIESQGNLQKKQKEIDQVDQWLTEAVIKTFSGKNDNVGIREKINLFVAEIERLRESSLTINKTPDLEKQIENLNEKIKKDREELTAALDDNFMAIQRIQKRANQQCALILDDKNNLLKEKERLNVLLIEAIKTIHEGDPNFDHKEIIHKETKDKVIFLIEKVKELKNLESEKYEDIERESQEMKEAISILKSSTEEKDQKIQQLEKEMENNSIVIRNLKNSGKLVNSDKGGENDSEFDEPDLSKSTDEELKEHITSLRKSVKDKNKELLQLRKLKEVVANKVLPPHLKK